MLSSFGLLAAFVLIVATGACLFGAIVSLISFVREYRVLGFNPGMTQDVAVFIMSVGSFVLLVCTKFM